MEVKIEGNYIFSKKTKMKTDMHVVIFVPLIEQNKILEGLTFRAIPTRVECISTSKGQELVASKVILLLWMRKWPTLNYDVQQISLFSHLQFTGSFRHIGQIIAPQPTQVLSALLHAQ